MAEKTHIVKQEESIEEKSTQVRAGEPVALKDPHYWLDTNSNRLYLYIGGSKYVIANGQKFIAMAGGLTIDAKFGQMFHKTTTANISIAVSNLDEAGSSIKVVVHNTDVANHTVNFTGITIANLADMVTTVIAGRIAIFEFIVSSGAVYALTPVRTESVFA